MSVMMIILSSRTTWRPLSHRQRPGIWNSTHLNVLWCLRSALVRSRHSCILSTTKSFGMSPPNTTSRAISSSPKPFWRFWRLCVCFSDNLSFSTHIDKMCSKTSRMLGFLNRNFRSCPQKLCELAYVNVSFFAWVGISDLGPLSNLWC